MNPINSATPVPALVPALSGYLSNASTTPGSSAPTTPTSEKSGISFRHTLSGSAKGKISDFKTSLIKFRTSTKCFLSKKDKMSKKSKSNSPVATVDVNEVERVSAMEMAARFQDADYTFTLDIQDGGGQISTTPSQASLVPLYNENFSPSPTLDKGFCHEDASLDSIDRCCPHPELEDLVVMSETAELSAMETTFLQCLPMWSFTILSCIAVCLAVATAYGIYWASTVSLFCLIHPDSPVWPGIAFVYGGRRESTHPE